MLREVKGDSEHTHCKYRDFCPRLLQNLSSHPRFEDSHHNVWVWMPTEKVTIWVHIIDLAVWLIRRFSSGMESDYSEVLPVILVSPRPIKVPPLPSPPLFDMPLHLYSLFFSLHYLDLISPFCLFLKFNPQPFKLLVFFFVFIYFFKWKLHFVTVLQMLFCS